MIFKPQILFQDGHGHVHRDGNPYLRPCCVRRQAIERFDSEMLLYPFEKQFHLPAELVQLGNHQGWKDEVVCEKSEPLSLFLVEIDDPSQPSRIILSGFLNGEHNSLIASETGGLVHRTRIQPTHLGIAFRPGEEKGQSRMIL